MYEDITYEYFMDKLLSNVPSDVDKREGSLIWNTVAPVAMELCNVYVALDMIINESFADTASMEYLVRRAAERGILPRNATNAVLKGVFNCEIPIGDRFTLGTMTYIVKDKISDLEYKLECETAGSEGNMRFGTLLPIEYIEQLKSAQLTELLIPGEDEEEEEEFRERYFASLNSQAFGGNKEQYKKEVSSISGVGGVKVYPAWNGGGTVKLVIITSDFDTANNDFIDMVQTLVDPAANSGKGIGIAPIGHKVTVESVSKIMLDIESVILYNEGFNYENTKDAIEKVVDNYFAELNKEWDKQEKIIVRISQIETRLLTVKGILDIRDTKINGNAENFEIDNNSIAARGEINV